MHILRNFALAVALGLLLATLLERTRSSPRVATYVQYQDDPQEPDVDYSPHREQLAMRHPQK